MRRYGHKSKPKTKATNKQTKLWIVFVCLKSIRVLNLLNFLPQLFARFTCQHLNTNNFIIICLKSKWIAKIKTFTVAKWICDIRATQTQLTIITANNHHETDKMSLIANSKQTNTQNAPIIGWPVPQWFKLTQNYANKQPNKQTKLEDKINQSQIRLLNSQTWQTNQT